MHQPFRAPRLLALALFALLMVFSTAVFADTIDFESLSGPSTFAAAGNAQTLNISTGIGTVQISGGVILTNTTNLPADETTIYGTAGNASNIGVSVGTGFTNPLVLTFPTNINNFFLDVLNGNVQDVTYTVADNNGHSASFTVPPNLNSGSQLVGFAAAGNVITIAATTGQSTPNGITWDFFVDNIHFDEPLPPPLQTPEPGSLALLGTGLAGLMGFLRRRQK